MLRILTAAGPVLRHKSRLGPGEPPSAEKRARHHTAVEGMAAEEVRARLEYLQAVYQSTIDWYKAADAKGQLLLTLNGVYITVLTSAILISPQDLAARKATLGGLSWVLLSVAATMTALSILAAIACLRSRLSGDTLRRYRESLAHPSEDGRRRYRPVATFWFGTLAVMESDMALDMLYGADIKFHVQAVGEELVLLAPNVLAKHRWVNTGWIAAGANLLLLLATVASVIVGL